MERVAKEVQQLDRTLCPALGDMKEFYVRLNSGVSQGEFPQNKANSFRNRLPDPIRLTEPGWKVGLASLHVPKAPPRLKVNDPFLFRFKWDLEYDPSVGLVTTNEVKFHAQEMTQRRNYIQTGMDLMNAVRQVYYKKLEDQTVSDLKLYTTEDEGTENERDLLFYMVMEKNDNDPEGYIIDNSRTFTGDTKRYASLTIGKQLAMDMGWLERKFLHGRLKYVLGPNLRKDFPTDEIPTAIDLKIAQANGDETFFKVDLEGLHLSSFCNWVFTNLNEAFARAYGYPQRPLFVHSNAAQSSMVGDEWTDLLRDVSYSLPQRGYQFHDIQYLPVRTPIMDILDVQVKEENGTLVDFADKGNTVVTLHFKHGW